MRQRKPDPKRQQLLAERAHGMRHAPTESEAALFRLLSGKQLGVQFRRQVPLGGRYIADLLAPSLRCKQLRFIRLRTPAEAASPAVKRVVRKAFSLAAK